MRSNYKTATGVLISVFIFLSFTISFAGQITYYYDAANRLIQVTESGIVIEYVYDKVGNLQQRITRDIIAADPSSKDFGSVTIGSTSPIQSFTLANSGTDSIVISSVFVGGLDSASFAIAVDTCSGQTLLPSATCMVQAAFSPSVTGIRGANLFILLSSPAGVTHDIPLSGTGVAPVISASSLSFNFGSVNVASSSPAQTVTVSNSGTESLILGTLTMTGTNASEFQIVSPDGCSGKSIAPLANCTVQMTFNPSTGGAKSASLTIPSNDPITPTTIVTLSGTGSVSVSGSVTYGGASLSGVTMTLSGAASGTTTTDSSGNYTFTGLAAGSYTVTPSKTGYTFSPINRAVSVSGANVTGQNFIGAGIYSISGSVKNSKGKGISSVQIYLLGAIYGLGTVTDSSGNYTFTGLAADSYTITPSKPGYAFTPMNKTVTVSGANLTGQNFTGAVAYSISGTVTLGGNSFSGVTMTLSGAASGTTTTDSSGNYTFSGLAAGSYTVTPSKAGYSFTPMNKAVTINSANVTGQNFTCVSGYLISGSVKTSNKKVVSGVTMTLSGATSATATTDSSGNYTFNGLVNGTYTVTPTMAGYTFTPASRSVTINSANVTSQNFTRN